VGRGVWRVLGRRQPMELKPLAASGVESGIRMEEEVSPS